MRYGWTRTLALVSVKYLLLHTPVIKLGLLFVRDVNDMNIITKKITARCSRASRSITPLESVCEGSPDPT